MATERKSILARVHAAIEKSTAADQRKRNARANQVREALKGIAGVEFVESGKTIIVVFNGAKVGAINNGIHAFARTDDDKVGHVRVTAAELAAYVQELVAREKK